DEAVAADFRVICPEGRAEFAVSSSSAFIAPLNDCAKHFLSSDLSVPQMSTATPMPTATPTRTPIPTPTADPCRREIIAAPIADMNRLMTDFLQAGTVYSATFSPVALQAMGNASTAFAELRVPACLREAKDEGIAFMRLN